MDLEALQLLSRFALPPNSLKYCGRKSAPERFKACVLRGETEGIEEEVEKFIILNPYLKALGQILHLDPFDYRTVEAYCLGNDLLHKVKGGDYPILLELLEKQGMPEDLLQELKNRHPRKFIPTHMFHVLYVGVGRASGAVPFNLDSINNCMIRWGVVSEHNGARASVLLNSLRKVENKYQLTLVQKNVDFIPGFVPRLRVGSFVAVHWNLLIKELGMHEVNNLAFWTEQVLDLVNEP